jgi:hypothetical protein
MRKLHILLAAAIALSAPTMGFSAPQSADVASPAPAANLASSVQAALNQATLAGGEFDAVRARALAAMQAVIIEAGLDPATTQAALTQVRTGSRPGQSALDLLRARVQLANVVCPVDGNGANVLAAKVATSKDKVRARQISSEETQVDQRCEGLSVSAIGGQGDFVGSPLGVALGAGSDYRASVP